MLYESWQERICQSLGSFNKSMRRVAICLNCGNHYVAAGAILHLFRMLHDLGTPGHGLFKDGSGIINMKRDVPNTISVLLQMLSEFLRSFGIQRTFECEYDVAVSHNMTRVVSIPSFQTLVSHVFEAELVAIVACRLLRVADPERDVVEAVEYADFRPL